MSDTRQRDRSAELLLRQRGDEHDAAVPVGVSAIARPSFY